jgi:hypothetical protein
VPETASTREVEADPTGAADPDSHHEHSDD